MQKDNEHEHSTMDDSIGKTFAISLSFCGHTVLVPAQKPIPLNANEELLNRSELGFIIESGNEVHW